MTSPVHARALADADDAAQIVRIQHLVQQDDKTVFRGDHVVQFTVFVIGYEGDKALMAAVSRLLVHDGAVAELHLDAAFPQRAQ